ncbi:MAG: arsenate reductase ArsC [bacterium]|nr:arsenate reductase ArsC [bacterium]
MKRVLFLGVANARRSKIAEAFALRFGEGVMEAASAGTRPGEAEDPMAVAVMRERGLDTPRPAPRGAADLDPAEFDICVHFGCLDEGAAAGVRSARSVDWGDVADTAGRPYSEYRQAREEIGRRVLDLIRSIRGGG